MEFQALTEKSSGAKIRFIIGLFILFLFFIAYPVFSDSINYIYDDMGRLAATQTSGGITTIYNYDSAGRLISTIRTTVNQGPQPPVLTGITPNQIFIGNEVWITITGNNLSLAEFVSTDNPGILIKSFSATDNSITIDAQIQNTAAIGPANLTVQTPSGSASVSLNLLNLTLTPDTIFIVNGASAGVAARIDGLASDYNLTLTNKNPDIISAPQSLIVPVSESATFNITGISNGTGVVTAGNSRVTVYVTQPFTGSMTASAKPISIIIKQNLQASSTTMVPVSVKVESTISGATTTTVPISVKVESTISGITTSIPVSVSKTNQ